MRLIDAVAMDTDPLHKSANLIGAQIAAALAPPKETAE